MAEAGKEERPEAFEVHKSCLRVNGVQINGQLQYVSAHSTTLGRDGLTTACLPERTWSRGHRKVQVVYGRLYV